MMTDGQVWVLMRMLVLFKCLLVFINVIIDYSEFYFTC